MNTSWIACLLHRRRAPAPRPRPPAAPARRRRAQPTYQHLVDAAHAVVGIKVKALANARSARTLGHGARGQRRALRPAGARAHHRLPHPRGRPGRDHHQQRPHRARHRGRVRPRHRLRAAAPVRAPRREADPPRRLRQGRLARPHAGGRERRRGEPLGRDRGVEAPVRGLLGVPHRRRDLHLAAARRLRRRRAHQQGRRARGHRLALRDGRDDGPASACPATCSCRSTC